MATLTIRNIPAHVIRGLKSLARQRKTSVNQEVRQLLEEYVAEDVSMQKQIEASWSRQERRPSAAEIDNWITAGRE